MAPHPSSKLNPPFEVRGDANDYVGKSMHGGRIRIRPVDCVEGRSAGVLQNGRVAEWIQCNPRHGDAPLAPPGKRLSAKGEMAAWSHVVDAGQVHRF